MSEEEITVSSGVSWFQNKINAMLEDRKDSLAHTIAGGVPEGEYRQMVGRYKETCRLITEFGELFAEFYEADEEDGDGLEEIK